MRNTLCKILVVVIFALSLGINSHAEGFPQYVDPGVVMNYKQDNININFLGALSADVTVLYCNGRLCIPLFTTAKSLGGSYVRKGRVIDIAISGTSISVPVDPEQGNRPSVFYYNGVMYISLYDFLEPLHFVPIVNTVAKRVVILGNHCDIDDEFLTSGALDSSTALLRLEDIVADGMDPDGNYDVGSVEKLRFAAQYLYARRQQYYIAWVPVYKNPKRNITNDLTVDYNLYNSYFLYVLDYMTDHGGHIGLHGYTHQYGEDRSTVGNEWGKETPFTVQEQKERFVKAKETAAKLGFKDEFFEFPHYSATKEQLMMAEHYFDAIYQSYRNDDNSVINKIYKTKRSGREVTYIPTPADYVKSAKDREIIIKTLESVVKDQNSVSMFYHPVLDEKWMYVVTSGRERVWSYSHKGILPGIVNYIGSHHFMFATYD